MSALLESQTKKLESMLAEYPVGLGSVGWSDVDGGYAGFIDSPVPALVHEETGFFFALAVVPREWVQKSGTPVRQGGGNFWVHASPGAEAVSETLRELKWDEVTVAFRRWLDQLTHELEAMGRKLPRRQGSFAGFSLNAAPGAVNRSRLRADLLDQLYRAAGGTSGERIKWSEVPGTLGVDEAEAEKALDYLIGEGWAEWVTMGNVALTHRGLLRIEGERPVQKPAIASPANVIPPELQTSLATFRDDHGAHAATAFIMMEFGDSRLHREIAEGIRAGLAPYGIVGLRADDKEYHEDLFYNVLTYVYGCTFGIAVFERLESDTHNPNVALEVGYMRGVGKNVCLLKDRTLGLLTTDLMGKLYRKFDPQEPGVTIPPALGGWLRDKGFVVG